jgi:hypothetical protein
MGLGAYGLVLGTALVVGIAGVISVHRTGKKEAKRWRS